VDEKNGRNLYFCGVTAFLERDYVTASKYFKDSMEKLRSHGGESYLVPECERGLGLSQRYLMIGNSDNSKAGRQQA